jgi:hypothetical protein
MKATELFDFVTDLSLTEDKVDEYLEKVYMPLLHRTYSSDARTNSKS